jgi:hypothetical protein
MLGEKSYWIDEKENGELNIILRCGMCKLVITVVDFKERV